MFNKIKSALLILVCIAVVMPLESCLFNRQERQSDDDHYKHEPRMSDRAVLDRNAR